MSDIKLFRLSTGSAQEIKATSVALEKSLQQLIEKHLDVLLGVQFLASEHSTGAKHGGRIDTLGIDENGCPVIIEYKRSLNENVINQGLYYLDWLMDHKAEFELLVQRKLGHKEADEIEWDKPRLICIAGDFTKFDAYAVGQINKSITLIRYGRYGDDLLMFELVNSQEADTPTQQSPKPVKSSGDKPAIVYRTFADGLAQASPDLRDRYEAFNAFAEALGDDVQSKQLKYYVAFRRLKNFACAEVHTRTNNLVIFLKVNPKSIKLEEGFSRDVSELGHYGTGDLELIIRNMADLERAKPLIAASYEAS